MSYHAEFNKFILFAPFGMFVRHIVCKEGLLVDPTKIALTMNFPPPTNVKQLRALLVHTGYYSRFIRGYSMITTPMENFLKKDA